LSQLALGLALDLILGDPAGWPHPVRWIGRAVERGFGLIRRRSLSPAGERRAGLALSLTVILGVLAASWLLLFLLEAIWPPLAWLAGGLLAYTCLALRDLIGHVRPILSALKAEDLGVARRRLSRVVGRETVDLDQAGVSRAALETLAESLCDGVVAPLFYLVLGGPALGLAYKAVNTLDSMLGYRHEPFEHVGCWPARLDDAVNWLPARLSFLLVVAGAALCGRGPGRAWRTGLAEHGRSHSPNAGWTEAALAGALDVSLAGPAVYAGQRVDKPYFNEGGRPPGPAELKAGLGLIWAAGLTAYGLGALWSLRGLIG